MRGLRNLIRHGVAMGLLAMTLHALGAQGLLEQMPDPPDIPGQAEVDAWEERARAGDWTIKQHFAAAYLYQALAPEYWDRGCRHLKHGHFCRALAERRETGRSSLYEIVELPGDGPVIRKVLARLQADLARRRVLDARTAFDPEHPACREAVRYYERAIENEVVMGNGQSCTATRMFEMAWHGQCLSESREQASRYAKLSRGCPQY
ncbi:MAG: hypothetical protein IPJ99_00330 [Betaproteobacteria bacterium]|nr:hypothetical protein [Betaproteobacteria bacterium]